MEVRFGGTDDHGAKGDEEQEGVDAGSSHPAVLPLQLQLLRHASETSLPVRNPLRSRRRPSCQHPSHQGEGEGMGGGNQTTTPLPRATAHQTWRLSKQITIFQRFISSGRTEHSHSSHLPARRTRTPLFYPTARLRVTYGSLERLNAARGTVKASSPTRCFPFTSSSAHSLLPPPTTHPHGASPQFDTYAQAVRRCGLQRLLEGPDSPPAPGHPAAGPGRPQCRTVVYRRAGKRPCGA